MRTPASEALCYRSISQTGPEGPQPKHWSTDDAQEHILDPGMDYVDMCGIAGIVGGKHRGEAMSRMLASLAHRGPDDQGTWSDEVATLGQRRLSIIDLVGGKQPLHSADKRYWLVCNGEIYNYRELREDMLRKGRQFLTGSDCELILHLYAEFGERCLDYLRGMFAFALWDSREKVLFAARDHLGQKPLFYAEHNGGLLLASEIKGVLAAEPVLRKLDPESLDQYLALRLIAPPRTMFSGVRKLPPGHWLRFTLRGGLEIGRYWDLDYRDKLEGSDEELTDALEEQLIEALRLHMVSDVPVGAFMSGGLDSTLIVAMLMKHVASSPIPTFTLSLPHANFNEGPIARLVAERYGTEHHEETVTPSLVSLLPKLVYHLDEPSDPLSLCAYLVSQVARREVKVVIGGDGGDELFGGYDRYYGNLYANLYARLPLAIRRYGIGPLLDLLPEGRWYKSRTHQLKWLHKMAFQREGARYSGSLSYFYFDSATRPDLYGPAMLGYWDGLDAESVIRDLYDSAPAHEALDRMLYADSKVRLPDHPVMISDRMTMAHGLEGRSPFMDHVVAGFAARLPTHLKVCGRTTRVIQRRLAERYLPREVLEMPKQGFSSALPYMLRDEYPVLFNAFLRDSRLVQEGFLRENAVSDLLDRHLGGREDNSNRLWLLLNSEIWYRMQIDGDSMDVTNETLGQASQTARVA